MQVCKAESHVLIQVYLNVGVSLHEFFHQTASVCAFEVACATLRSVCLCLCLWEFFFVWTCARLHCVLHRLCMCTVCVCASYICSAKASVCDSLDVSAASFIPSDIPASILWAQEQLATPVGHFHNKPIAIYEPDATHSLIQTRLCKGKHIQYAETQIFSWLLLMQLLLCCCFVAAPSGSNSQSWILLQMCYHCSFVF